MAVVDCFFLLLFRVDVVVPGRVSQAPALPVEYTSLPGAVTDVIVPLFGIRLSPVDRQRMFMMGSVYSKVG